MSNQDRFRKNATPGAPEIWVSPIGSGTVVEVSDILALSGGKAVRMATTTDNLALIGPARQAHGATNGSGSIEVGKPNGSDVYEYDLDATTTVSLGDLFQWNAPQKVKKSTTNPIFMAVEAKVGATSIRGVFLTPNAANGPRAVGDAS